MNVTPTIVHALRHGFPLCEFTRIEPGKWPDGHAWINSENFNNPETGPGAARCPGCLVVLDRGKPPDPLSEIDYHGIAIDYARRCGALGTIIADLLTDLHRASAMLREGCGPVVGLGTSWRDAGGDFERYRERLAAINLKSESLGSHNAGPTKGDEHGT